MSWACSSGTSIRSGGSRPSCAMIARRQSGRTMSGPWNEADKKTVRGTVFPPNVHDQLALGNKLRILTIVDTHSRFCPAADPRFTYRGEDVVQTLERVCAQLGYPRTIRVDNGSEFISRDLDLWAYANDVTLDFSRPGKPTDNGFILRRENSPPDCFLFPPHIQQQAPVRMPERSLVHEPCGCTGKAGGLASTLQ